MSDANDAKMEPVKGLDDGDSDNKTLNLKSSDDEIYRQAIGSSDEPAARQSADSVTRIANDSS